MGYLKDQTMRKLQLTYDKIQQAIGVYTASELYKCGAISESEYCQKLRSLGIEFGEGKFNNADQTPNT